jgi:hypothetical protein
MNIGLVTEYPIWFILFCLLAGTGYAALLYYKEQKLIEVQAWLKWLLVVFRFIVITLLSFLLLSPLLKTIQREVEKPIVVVAQDNSESILIHPDSAYYKNKYKQELNDFIQALGQKYDVRSYSFGDKVKEEISFDYREKQTDLSALLKEMNSRYANRNLGAMVICSDGLYNKGEDPIYTTSSGKVPIYTIALGDTTVKKDVLITKVRHNKMAYLGNSFPVEILVEAHQVKGKNAQVSISKNDEVFFTQNLNFTSGRFSASVPVQVLAKEKGLQKYRVKISSLEGEVTYTNNVQDIFIEVMDGREKILLLAAAPHPDVSALKAAIENNENYEIKVILAADFKGNFNEYNLVIAHQIPSEFNAYPNLISELVKSDVPLLHILGNQSNLAAFNSLQTGVTLPDSRTKPNEAQGTVDKGFTLFTLSDEARNLVPKFPPLLTPFGNYKLSNAATTFISQKIGSVTTAYPLVLFSEVNSRKTGVIVGEGIWRWRLADFQEHRNHVLFNELINKMVQYLSVKIDKSLFRVSSKRNYYENEELQFDAELYNESYELINEPELSLEIRNSEKKRFPFSFSKTANAYRLSTNAFPVGEYTYEASVRVGDKLRKQSGSFSVSTLVIESIATSANHSLLYKLAKKNDGEMYAPKDLLKLQNLLLQREDILPVSYTEKKLKELINLKWVFFLLLALLSLEWFLRKRNGAY